MKSLAITLLALAAVSLVATYANAADCGGTNASRNTETRPLTPPPAPAQAKAPGAPSSGPSSQPQGGSMPGAGLMRHPH